MGIKKLLRTLDNVMEHVDKAGVGSTDPAILRLLQDVVASAPLMPAVQSNQMFNSRCRTCLWSSTSRTSHAHSSLSPRSCSRWHSPAAPNEGGGEACIPCEERPCCGFSLWR